MSKRRTIILRSALLAMALLLPLALAEGTLRLIGFQYKFYPDKIEFGWPDPKEFSNVYVPDPELLWVQPDYQAKLAAAREGSVDVVFMGCSCTEFGKYDQFLAERLAAESGGQQLSYLNVGVGGWTSYQGVQQLRRDVLPLKPKLITIYYGWNDHWLGFGLQDKEIASFNKGLLYSLRNVRLVQLGARAWIGTTGRDDGEFPTRVAPEDFRANLTAMVREAKAAGVTPMLLTAPHSYIEGREPGYLAQRWLRDPSRVIPLHEQYTAIVREVAAAEGALLCDLAAAFDALPPRDVSREYFKVDGIHLREAGDRKIAEVLQGCFAGAEVGELTGGEAVQLPGREYPGGAEPVPPLKDPGDPSLPTILNVSKVRFRSHGEITVRGSVFSPHVIDHVVVQLDGINHGAAHYPRYNEANIALHPEYNDPWSDFVFERPVPHLVGRDTVEVTLLVYSGDEVVARNTLTAK